MAINREKVLDTAQKYVEKKRYDKAIIELRSIIDADPNDVRTLQKIAEVQIKQGLYAEAIDTYESVGKLYTNGGFSAKAVAVYKQIRELIASHAPQVEARYGHIAPKLADLYREIGLTSEALALLNEVAANLRRQKKDTDAIAIYRKISELDPTNPIPHLHVAESLSLAKDVAGAVEGFQAAAALLIQAERRDDAIQVLERLLHHRADPEQARICAELYLSRNRSPQDGMQALTKLQQCFQANPRDVGVLTLIARAFDMIGQQAKANDIRKEIARLSRETGQAS